MRVLLLLFLPLVIAFLILILLLLLILGFFLAIRSRGLDGGKSPKAQQNGLISARVDVRSGGLAAVGH